jgi:cyclohexanone monooxygenase
VQALIGGSRNLVPATPRLRRIAIIGAGPGGISTAIRLREVGYQNIVIFERADGVGGTWYNNRYPGLACDVPSHLYSFSFDLNPSWSRAYSPQPEILAYMEGVVDRHNLRPHIRLSMEVVAAHWDDECTVWRVVLANSDVETFDVLVSAQGMFNLLNWPEIQGLQQFGGKLFHSARWESDYSLAGKKVAVIGSAASAVQFVPRIAQEVEELHLYQRSPNWVLPKDEAAFRQSCLENLAAVKDPELRAKLTPNFNWGCTRPLFSNEYYPAFNRQNVELITDGIREIGPDGVVDRTGKKRPADVIICATGYKTDKFLSAIEVTGRNGVRIEDCWREGAEAFQGITTAGFPNLFMIYGPNTNNGSLLFMVECQAVYIARHLQWMDRNDITWIDVRPDVMKAYNEELQTDIGKVELWKGGCHNYYRASSGRIVTQYPHTMTVYRSRTMVPDWDAFEYQCGVPL